MLKKTCTGLTILLLAMIIGLLAILGIPLLQGNQIYAVLTSSMEPAYPVGSVVVVKPVDAQEIEVDDVITFDPGGGFRMLATHRVIEKHPETQEFITKGDNNRAEDLEPVSYGSVVGKVLYGIPSLGAVATALKTGKGIMACVGILCFMIILMVLPEIFEKAPPKKQECE